MIGPGLKRNPKRRGEWVELKFMERAAGLELEVSKPWGDSARYDVGVECCGRQSKVQVKSTMCLSKHSEHSYVCTVHPNQNGRPYHRNEFDFLAAYVIPEDVWYIFPASVVLKGTMNMLILSPSVPGHRYERFKEAWHLLTERLPESIRRRPRLPRRLRSSSS